MGEAKDVAPPPTSSVVRDAVLLALAALIGRALFLLFLPDSAVSFDVPHTREVAERLARGENPYATTAWLNWPPFWMQVIYVLDRLAAVTAIGFDQVVVSFLVVVDAINIALAYLIAVRFLRASHPKKALMFGLVANPVSLFLVCQHRHFDVMVVTALLVFAIAILRYRESGDATDWLMAAFALGIGVLIKTIPVFLAPLLLFRISQLTRLARVFGAFLVIAPALIGMSVIYVLSPDEVARNVLGYRSYPGWFGVTGILELGGLSGISSVYARAFPLLVIIALVFVGRRLSQRSDFRPEQIVLAIATVLASLVALAPGYATQYIAWPLPFFVLSYLCFDPRWKADLVVAWIVSIVTYTVEYGLMTELGQFLIAIHPSPRLLHLADISSEPGVKTLLRLPLFAAYLWTVRAAFLRLRPVAQPPEPVR